MTPIVQACLWMLGTIVSFTSMAVAGREIGAAHDTFEIMLYRSIVGVIIVCIVLTANRLWHEVNTQQMGTHITRNFCHFTGQNLWFYALGFIPLSQLFALEFTTPIWALLLAPLILSERLTMFRVLAAVLGFVGILIVTRPGAMEINPGVIAGASSAIFFALSITLTKKLTRTQTIGCILFWLTVTQLGFGLIAVFFDGAVTWPTLQTAPYLMLIGLAGLCAHYCLTKALSLAPAAVVVPIDFARLPTIAVIGALFYSEAIDVYVLGGAVLIFAGNYLNIWHETRQSQT